MLQPRPSLLQFELPFPSCREMPIMAACPLTGRLAVYDGTAVLLLSCERGPVELLATLRIATIGSPITHLSMYGSHIAVGSERECLVLRVKLWAKS